MVDSLNQALRGRPSMRRALAGLGAGRAQQIAQHFAGRDLRRDASFIRRDLEAILRNEQDAAPIRRQSALREAINNPRTPSTARNSLQRQLRAERPGHITVNDQRNPLRWGSVARQRFGDLYRR